MTNSSFWESIKPKINIGMRVKYYVQGTSIKREGHIAQILDNNELGDGSYVIRTTNNEIGTVDSVYRDQLWNEEQLLKMIDNHESINFEMKETLLYDVDKSKINTIASYNQKLLFKVIEEIVSLMNTDGGSVCIGVRNDRTIMGLERDYLLLNKENKNNDENWDKFKEKIITKINHYVPCMIPDIRIDKIIVDGKDVCLIHIKKSPRPVMIKLKALNSIKSLEKTLPDDIFWEYPIRTSYGIDCPTPNEFFDWWINRKP